MCLSIHYLLCMYLTPCYIYFRHAWIRVSQVMSFLGKTSFVPMDMHNIVIILCHLKWFAHLFCPFHYYLSALHWCRGLLELQQSGSLMIYSFLMWFLLQMLHLVIYFRMDSGLLLSSSGTRSCSVCKIHLTLQECQVLALVLHRMAFHISGKIIDFYLDSNTAKAYLCH